MQIEIAYLHNHSKYSEKDAITAPKDYSKFIQKYNEQNSKYKITSFALTEHGHMFSMVKHNNAFTDTDIKPIYGCELYYCEDREEDKENRYHLVLLAKDNNGLRNLYRIVSDAGLNKIKGRSKDYPRTHDKTLQLYGKGIIAMSACLGGLIPKLILDGRYEDAKAKALYFKSIFDDFYLEIQPHEIPEQLLVNDALVKMSKETGIGLVITTDTHYLTKEDKKYHDILKTMAKQKPFNVDAHMKTPDELVEFIEKYNIPYSAIENTVKIANKCNVNPKPTDSRGLMPSYPVPAGYTDETFLRELAFNNLMEFIVKKKIKEPKKYLKQLLYELDVICSMGFASYFLILWDWFKWCRENNILMGKGRGSAAGSIISYLLSITTVDPIKQGFVFERFLNPERIEFPDVDSDVSKDDRPKAIKYLLEKYGEEYVAQIITFQEYKLKNTIKAVMSAYGHEFEEANKVTKSLPDQIDGNPATYDLIKDIAENPENYDELGSKTVNDVVRAYEMLIELFQKYPEVHDAVFKLNGVIAGTGIHAGGVIISSKPLKDNMPLIAGSETAILPLVQIEMNDLSFFNALKIDVLGLRTLTQIQKAMELIGLDYDWYDSEDFDDVKVYEMLRQGYTTDVFQMASPTATKLIRDMNVSNIEDLTVVNAGNRPGPLAKNKDTNKSMVDIYIENKNAGIIPSIDKRIDYILEPTQGCLWYQEQCLWLGQVMAGYSLGAADMRIRKVLAKKQMDKIPEIEIEFIYGKKPLKDENGNIIGPSDEPSPYCKGAINNGFSEEVAKNIFNIMKEFAKYSFNKSHSGSYAGIAYKTAWLSCYYPVEWAVACLSTYDETEKITATLTMCKKRGIKILPPDINKSDVGFTVEKLPDGEKAIRYGLLAIKDVGERAINLIKQVRQVEQFKDFDDFYNKMHNSDIITNLLVDETGKKVTNPINKKVEVALINAGAFDSFEENRYKLMNHYMQDIRKEKDYVPFEEDKYIRKVKLQLEKELMGSYISEHPLDPLPYTDLDNVSDGEDVEVAGIVLKINTKTAANGKKFATAIIETKDGKERKVMLFGDSYELYKSRFKKDEIVIVMGEYSKQYESIRCNRVKKIIKKSSLQQENEQTSNTQLQSSDVIKENVLDEALDPFKCLQNIQGVVNIA